MQPRNVKLEALSNGLQRKGFSHLNGCPQQSELIYMLLEKKTYIKQKDNIALILGQRHTISIFNMVYSKYFFNKLDLIVRSIFATSPALKVYMYTSNWQWEKFLGKKINWRPVFSLVNNWIPQTTRLKENIFYSWFEKELLSLIFIPDLYNNLIIFKEAQRSCLPILALIKVDEPLNVDYPLLCSVYSQYSIYWLTKYIIKLIQLRSNFFKHSNESVKSRRMRNSLKLKEIYKKCIDFKKWKNIQIKNWKKKFFFKIYGKNWVFRRKNRQRFLKVRKPFKNFWFSNYPAKQAYWRRRVYRKYKRWLKNAWFFNFNKLSVIKKKKYIKYLEPFIYNLMWKFKTQWYIRGYRLVVRGKESSDLLFPYKTKLFFQSQKKRWLSIKKIYRKLYFRKCWRYWKNVKKIKKKKKIVLYNPNQDKKLLVNKKYKINNLAKLLILYRYFKQRYIIRPRKKKTNYNSIFRPLQKRLQVVRTKIKFMTCEEIPIKYNSIFNIKKKKIYYSRWIYNQNWFDYTFNFKLYDQNSWDWSIITYDDWNSWFFKPAFIKAKQFGGRSVGRVNFSGYQNRWITQRGLIIPNSEGFLINSRNYAWLLNQIAFRMNLNNYLQKIILKNNKYIHYTPWKLENKKPKTYLNWDRIFFQRGYVDEFTDDFIYEQDLKVKFLYNMIYRKIWMFLILTLSIPRLLNVDLNMKFGAQRLKKKDLNKLKKKDLNKLKKLKEISKLKRLKRSEKWNIRNKLKELKEMERMKELNELNRLNEKNMQFEYLQHLLDSYWNPKNIYKWNSWYNPRNPYNWFYNEKHPYYKKYKIEYIMSEEEIQKKREKNRGRRQRNWVNQRNRRKANITNNQVQNNNNQNQNQNQNNNNKEQNQNQNNNNKEQNNNKGKKYYHKKNQNQNQNNNNQNQNQNNNNQNQKQNNNKGKKYYQKKKQNQVQNNNNQKQNNNNQKQNNNNQKQNNNNQKQNNNKGKKYYHKKKQNQKQNNNNQVQNNNNQKQNNNNQNQKQNNNNQNQKQNNNNQNQKQNNNNQNQKQNNNKGKKYYHKKKQNQVQNNNNQKQNNNNNIQNNNKGENYYYKQRKKSPIANDLNILK
jgi:hypothetical protein